jgi:hypothetical protein
MSSDASILFANNLQYKLPIPSSVVTNRCLKRNYFQNRSYAQEQTMTCQLGTGTDFVDLKNSALVMKIKLNNTRAAEQSFGCSFGEGSACNLIRNIRISHRSGTSYTNTQKLNLWRKIHDKYTHSKNWFETVGTLMGYGQPLLTDAIPDGEFFNAIIPLTHLHPFFNPEGGVMLPANMASGLRVELDLAPLAEAFVVKDEGFGDGAPTSYEIVDCYFQTMNISLMDSAHASLNTVAQKSALEYVYKDIFTSQNSHPSNTNQVNVDINKSVAFADVAFAVVQDTASLTDKFLDSFRSGYLNAKWDYTLGSNHYPNVKVDDLRLAYHNALQTFDKFKHSDKECSTTLRAFIDTDSIYSVSLERDTALALSQAPVNASRALRFELTFDTPPTTAQLVTVYMTYITSCRSTLLNSKVDI